MEIKQRSIRRHHYERLKKNRMHYFGGNLSDLTVGRAVSTPRPCSCFGCGKRSYLKGPTVRERKFLVSIKLLLNDMN